MEVPQHVQLPNREEQNEITPNEQLIYIAIKRFMNKTTKEAYPSLATIAKLTKADIKTIRKAIQRLETLGYLTVTKKGRSQIYKFSPYKNFEPFSYEFLDREDLSFQEKAYIISSQQYMFLDNENNGVVKYTDRELESKINMSHAVISKCNQSLEAKGYMDRTEQGKVFHLTDFGQAVVGILRNHEDRLTQVEQDNIKRDATIEELKQQIAEMKKETTQLKRVITKKNKELTYYKSEPDRSYNEEDFITAL